MKLSDRHIDILKKTLAHGKFQHRDSVMFGACRDLVTEGLLEFHDDFPSHYTLTKAGENVAEDLKTAKKSDKFYVYATGSAA